MPKKKRSIEQLKQIEQLTLSELGQVAGLTYGTVKHYFQEGLLSFNQERPGANKYFNQKESLKTLEKIDQLKNKGLTVAQIRKKTGGKKILNAPQLDQLESDVLKQVFKLAIEYAPDQTFQKEAQRIKKKIFA